MAEAVQAFLDAADDLLAAQQRLMPHPLSEELRALTEDYLAMRGALTDGHAAAVAAQSRVRSLCSAAASGGGDD